MEIYVYSIARYWYRAEFATGRQMTIWAQK